MKLNPPNLIANMNTMISLIVLVPLITYLIIATVTMQQATNVVKVSTDRQRLCQQLLAAFTQEAALRDTYMLHPTAAIRKEHLTVDVTITQQVHRLQQSVTPLDGIPQQSFSLQRSYLSSSAQLFAAIDVRNFAFASTLRNKIQPLFYQIEQTIAGQASSEATTVTQAVDQITQLELKITVIGFGALALMLALLGISLHATRTYRKQLDKATRAEISSLERLAFTDPLTGLGNHFAYQQQLARLLEETRQNGKVLVLAWLDIDEFNILNDEHGYQRGDDLLSDIATLLPVAGFSQMCYRLNADDFAFILVDHSLPEATVAFERLREDIQRRLNGITVSIGIAHTSSVELPREALEAEVTVALQEAKRRGRNRVVVFARIAGSVSMIPMEKTRAARRLLNEHNVKVAFQPIWDLTTDRVVAFESLIRPDPSYGFSGPQELFDVVEQIGRTHELDVICVQAILARAAELPRNTLLFLNLSPQSLLHDLLSGATLLAAVVNAGLEPSRVVLEITERSMVPPAQIIEQIKFLQLLGFRVALDDAGTGNAGLEMLCQLSVDYVKIDRAIVVNALHDQAARSIFLGLITIARESQIHVVAEGIENIEVLDFVRKSGVTYAQGYLLGRPSETIEYLDTFDSLDAFLAPLSPKKIAQGRMR